MNKKEAKKILHETLGNYFDKGHELLFSCPSCNHTSVNSLLTSTKMFLSVGFVIIAVVILGALFRRFGSYLQLQKWGLDFMIVQTLERFADLI